MGITPSVIDQTLYDAFGQRQISTLYTQLNQYHVILETMPSFQKNPAKLQDIYVRSALAPASTSTANPSTTVITSTTASGGSSSSSPSPNASSSTGSGGSSNRAPVTAINGAAVPLSTFTHFETTTAPLSVNHQGQFPVVTISFNLAPNASLGEATK